MIIRDIFCYNYATTSLKLKTTRSYMMCNVCGMAYIESSHSVKLLGPRNSHIVHRFAYICGI